MRCRRWRYMPGTRLCGTQKSKPHRSYRLPDKLDALTSYAYYQQAAQFGLQLLVFNSLCTPRCALTSTARFGLISELTAFSYLKCRSGA
jgi:hypothetical protein